MLGPSGSGKTTTLRMIAGFERPDAGSVELAGEDVSRPPAVRARRQHRLPGLRAVPAHERGRQRRLRPARQEGAAGRSGAARDEALEMVRLPASAAASPRQLSGGQRQRVALARAIVNRPQVLLLDEPLGALDLKLRQEMQVELKRIQQEVGITFVYVTHDQEEALTMSDRLAVFNDGRIEQIGAPAEVYEHPRSEFIAGFVGVSNVLERGGRRFTIRPEKVRLLDGAARRPAHRGGRGARRRLRRHGHALPRRPRARRRAAGRPPEPGDLSAAGPRPAGPHGDGGMERGAHVRDPGTRRAREVREMGRARRGHGRPGVDGRLRRRRLQRRSAGDVKAPEGPKALDRARRGRGQVNLSPGPATSRTARPTRRSTGSRTSRRRPAARSTRRSATPPTRWSR